MHYFYRPTSYCGALSGSGHQHQPVLWLGRAWAAALCSFKIEVVVCAIHPAEGTLILHDSSGDLEVDMDLRGRTLEPGQRIRLEGEVSIKHEAQSERVPAG